MPPAASNPKGITAIRGKMATTARQETFQLGYVNSVAAAAGCATGTPIPDTHGIDISFEYTDPDASEGSDPTASLRAQLKTWTGLLPANFRGGSTDFSYPLKNKNLSKLNYDPPTEHKILILMLVPAQPKDWIAPQPTEEILRSKCFWVNLRGVPVSGTDPESTTSIRVPIGK